MIGKKNIFVDTNIWIYALTIPHDNLDLEKHNISLATLEKLFVNKNIFISVQIINEVHWNLLRKFKMKNDNIKSLIDNKLIAISKIKDLTFLDYKNSNVLRNKYSFSFWDSLIVASALENDCDILYSEDMQHNQVIDEKLKIINPFLV